MAPCASFAFLRYIVISAQGLKIRLHVSAQHVSTICKGTEALPNICFGLSRRSPRLISHREERKEGNRPRLKSWKRRWMERATRYRARLKDGRTSRRKVSAVMINKCAWGAAFERVLQRMYIYIYTVSPSHSLVDRMMASSSATALLSQTLISLSRPPSTVAHTFHHHVIYTVTAWCKEGQTLMYGQLTNT